MFRSDTHSDIFRSENVEKSKVTRTQILASLAVSLGSMIVGFFSAWSSPAIASLMEPKSHIVVTESVASWIGSILPLAALVGGVTGGPLLEAFGRKITILATGIPFMTAGLLVTFAQNVYTIYAGRVITGFCIGIVSLSLPVYLAEAIHPEVRGILGLLPTTIGNGGVMLCYILGFWLDWSKLSLAGSVLPIPFLILVCMIPETPRYLIAQNKGAKARSALQWLRGQDTDITFELAEMENANIIAKKNQIKFSELFSVSYLKPLGISLGLMFIQQFSGINAVMFYSVSIFKTAGSSLNPNICTIILGIVNIMATIFSNTFIDKLGRKILLYFSAIGMIISLGVFGAYFYLKDLSGIEVPGWIPLLALMVYVVSFSIGFGPIPWLMMGEIFPSRIRGPAASISTAFNWTCTFIVTKTFMELKAQITTHGVFWLFGVILILAIFFIFFCVPETQGLTLEEIENLYTPFGTPCTTTFGIGHIQHHHTEEIVELNQFQSHRRINRRRLSSIANLKPMPSTIL